MRERYVSGSLSFPLSLDIPPPQNIAMYHNGNSLSLPRSTFMCSAKCTPSWDQRLLSPVPHPLSGSSTSHKVLLLRDLKLAQASSSCTLSKGDWRLFSSSSSIGPCEGGDEDLSITPFFSPPLSFEPWTVKRLSQFISFPPLLLGEKLIYREQEWWSGHVCLWVDKNNSLLSVCEMRKEGTKQIGMWEEVGARAKEYTQTWGQEWKVDG